MAKPKPSLSGALDIVEIAPASPPAAMQSQGRTGRPRRTEQTTLVGAQLAIRYGRSLNMLSAETGKSNRELLEEALDMLFVAKGAKILGL